MNLNEARAIIEAHLQKLQPLFKPDVKLTFLARSEEVANGDADIVVTNDRLRAAALALDRRAQKG